MGTLQKILLLIIIAGSLGYSARELLIGPCDSPIEYRIGSVDQRFDISESELRSALAEAERMWEDAAGKELFAYAPDGDLPVRLVYDERQAISERNAELETRIDATEGAAARIKSDIETARGRYEDAKREYDALVSDFEGAQQAYVEKVSYWNSRGGAPEGEYNKLERERAELQERYAALEAQRAVLNDSADRANSLVDSYNGLVSDIHEDVAVINETADKEFEQGEYVYENGREEITIYKFEDRHELVRVLAHELAHALGLDHNDNPKSVMYYLNVRESDGLTAEDLSGLKTVCGIE